MRDGQPLQLVRDAEQARRVVRLDREQAEAAGAQGLEPVGCGLRGDGLEGVAPAVSASREGLAAADKAWFMMSLPVPSSALGRRPT